MKSRAQHILRYLIEEEPSLASTASGMDKPRSKQEILKSQLDSPVVNRLTTGAMRLGGNLVKDALYKTGGGNLGPNLAKMSPYHVVAGELANPHEAGKAGNPFIGSGSDFGKGGHAPEPVYQGPATTNAETEEPKLDTQPREHFIPNRAQQILLTLTEDNYQPAQDQPAYVSPYAPKKYYGAAAYGGENPAKPRPAGDYSYLPNMTTQPTIREKPVLSSIEVPVIKDALPGGIPSSIAGTIDAATKMGINQAAQKTLSTGLGLSTKMATRGAGLAGDLFTPSTVHAPVPSREQIYGRDVNTIGSKAHTQWMQDIETKKNPPGIVEENAKQIREMDPDERASLAGQYVKSNTPIDTVRDDAVPEPSRASKILHSVSRGAEKLGDTLAQNVPSIVGGAALAAKQSPYNIAQATPVGVGAYIFGKVSGMTNPPPAGKLGTKEIGSGSDFGNYGHAPRPTTQGYQPSYDQPELSPVSGKTMRGYNPSLGVGDERTGNERDRP